MFKQFSIAVATLGLIAATPVLASGKAQEPNAAPKDQTETKAKARYCIKSEPVTGSIMQGRICKTADQWLDEGIDVSKLPTHR
jgi:hypothetical protein